MCVARVCRAPQLQWLTHYLDNLTPLPAPAKPARQDPLVPALQAHQAHWTLLCPADLPDLLLSPWTTCPANPPAPPWPTSCLELAMWSHCCYCFSPKENTDPTKLHPGGRSYRTRSARTSTASLCKHPQKPRRSCRHGRQRKCGQLRSCLPPLCLSVTVSLSASASLCVSLDVFVSSCFPDSPVSLSLSPCGFSVIRET